MSDRARMTVEVTGWRPFERGTLRGFAEIYIPEIKLHIGDIAVHRHESGEQWCGLPARPRLDRDGSPLRGESGKIEYSRTLWFDSRAVSDAFSTAVLAALDRHLGKDAAA
jgi:hypothetical protein